MLMTLECPYAIYIYYVSAYGSNKYKNHFFSATITTPAVPGAITTETILDRGDDSNEQQSSIQIIDKSKFYFLFRYFTFPAL